MQMRNYYAKNRNMSKIKGKQNVFWSDFSIVSSIFLKKEGPSCL